MKTQKPLISVIMPVKNGEVFLAEAVESIRRQDCRNWEMIVVNDGSVDKTGEILEKFAKKDKRIRVINNKKSLGIGASLNKALKFAKGDYIARMDGDDVAYFNRFAKQVDYLERHSGVVAVGGQAEMIDGNGQVFALKQFPTDPKLLRDMIMWMVPMQHPIMMVRAAVYKKCHYDEKMTTAEDVDLMMKLLQYGEFGNVEEIVYQYRKADTSNGYHDVKKTFWLTMLSRWRGITRYGYRPTLKGLVLSGIQTIIVGLLPAKWIVRIYESRRFTWISERMSRILSGLSTIARVTTLL